MCGCSGSDIENDADVDELWASDSDGDDETAVAAAAAATSTQVIAVDVPDLPLRVLMAATATPLNAVVGSDAATVTSPASAVSEPRAAAQPAKCSTRMSRAVALVNRSFPFGDGCSMETDSVKAEAMPPSLGYAPTFGDTEARYLETALPLVMIPRLSPSEHLMLLGVATVTHTLYGGSLAASVDAAGELASPYVPLPSCVVITRALTWLEHTLRLIVCG
jgi:hypothetical protein